MTDPDPFEESISPGGAHHRLNLLAGDWEGSTRTWFEPGVLADESPMTGRMRTLLGGRFLLHEYEGSLNGEPFQGMAIYGFNLGTGKFEIAWIDSFHMGTGIMYSQNATAGEDFSATGSYTVPGGGPAWGWRTEIEMLDPDHLVITAYNIMPDGMEAKALETTYNRKTYSRKK